MEGSIWERLSLADQASYENGRKLIKFGKPSGDLRRK